MDEVPVAEVPEFESGFHKFMQTNHPEVIAKISESKDLGDDISGQLAKAIEEYKQTVAL